MNREKQHIWDKLTGKKPVRSMSEVVEMMTRFIDTYPLAYTHYGDKFDEKFIDDILYSLGKSLSDEYRYQDGYKKFKKQLLKHIIETTPEIENE